MDPRELQPDAAPTGADGPVQPGHAQLLSGPSDVELARQAHDGAHSSMMRLSYVVIGAWIVLMAGSIFGLFQLFTGGIKLQDASLAATIFLLLGNMLGRLDGIVQQTIGYWFGSSKGSHDKTAALVKGE